jgi:hypothetical protein
MNNLCQDIAALRLPPIPFAGGAGFRWKLEFIEAKDPPRETVSQVRPSDLSVFS